MHIEAQLTRGRMCVPMRFRFGVFMIVVIVALAPVGI